MNKQLKNEKKIMQSLEYLDRHSNVNERWVFIADDHLEDHSIIISSEGRVFNTLTGTFLKEYGEGNVKPFCYLNAYGAPAYTVSVEELVAECFLKKPKTEKRLVLDHIDGDITNNKASNLKWRTIEEMKAIRLQANNADYSINGMRKRMIQANEECEAWMEGYWNLYFKYVPEEERNKELDEGIYRKQVKSASDIYMFSCRDYKAEGVQPPEPRKENNIEDYTNYPF